MTRAEAEQLLQEARKMNNGPWVTHSMYVANLAERIAEKAGMEMEKAYVYALKKYFDDKIQGNVYSVFCEAVSCVRNFDTDNE